MLTDVVMPGLSGPELAALVAARYPRVRTLFVSGYPAGALDGATSFVSKPFTASELAGRIRQTLDSPDAH